MIRRAPTPRGLAEAYWRDAVGVIALLMALAVLAGAL